MNTWCPVDLKIRYGDLIDIAGYAAIAAEIEEKEREWQKTLNKNKEKICPHN